MKNDQSSPEMGDQPPPKEAVSLSLGEKLRAGIKQYNIDLVTLGLLIFYSISTISSSVEKLMQLKKI
ncbi:MAG: hypothetical protein IPH04_08270 [Saprospirales bacterium]|nr:hypothetical protein [Saprospirales bacterium]